MVKVHLLMEDMQYEYTAVKETSLNKNYLQAKLAEIEQALRLTLEFFSFESSAYKAHPFVESAPVKPPKPISVRTKEEHQAWEAICNQHRQNTLDYNERESAHRAAIKKKAKEEFLSFRNIPADYFETVDINTGCRYYIVSHELTGPLNDD